MATFRIITPLKDGPASIAPPGAVVALSDTDAAPLLLCGAIECADDCVNDQAAPPAPMPTPRPIPKGK